jgi:hypothetical protein
MKDVFNMFDKDGDGTISTDELEEVMQSMGEKSSRKELDDMINEVDKEGRKMTEREKKMVRRKWVFSGPSLGTHLSGGIGGVAVIRSPLTAVVPMGRGFDPLLGYFM